MAATAEDLGDAGRDNSFGWGLEQAADALALLTDGGGAENDPPTASFTLTCTELACGFDASGSFNSDGDIVAYSWDFGDGNSGSEAIVSHAYAADGAYTVTLTVTDDDGATGSSSQDVTVVAGAEFTLSATLYRVRGVHTVDLTRNGATSTNVDVYRNGALITTTANDGFHTDSTGGRGRGSYDYQVCEEDTSICSNTATVTF